MTKPITPGLRRLAADWLRQHDGYLRPAPTQAVHDWLTALGLQVAGGAMSADEATLRITAYADTFAERPSYWFTRATLRACAERFKFFPSVAELVEALTEFTAEREQQATQARRVVNSPDHPAPEIAMPRTQAQRLAELVEIKRMNGLDPNKSAASQIRADAPPPLRNDERTKPLYVWIMADGTRKLASERPEGGMSLAEASRQSAA